MTKCYGHEECEYNFAQKIGTDDSNISRWENGTTIPTRRARENICGIWQ